MSQFIKFVEIDLKDGRKTRVWAVLTIDGRHVLGQISWYSPWRKFSFISGVKPEQVILEEVCLRGIADFCQKQTGLHRQLIQSRKQTREKGKGVVQS